MLTEGRSRPDMVSRNGMYVHVLLVLFGMSSWISVNGLWVELPLLVSTLPEGWNLASFVTLIIQLANIGPVAYSIFRHLKPSFGREDIFIHFVLFLGTVSSFVLILFWDITLPVQGSPRSIPFLVLTFFLSLVDCTSSVLYFPFMGRFPSIFMTSFMVGEGLSGLFPSILSLIQGVGGRTQCLNVTIDNGTTWGIQPYTPPPRFSEDIFFIVLTVMMVVSWSAFFVLNNTQKFKRVQVFQGPQTQRKDPKGAPPQDGEYSDIDTYNLSPASGPHESSSDLSSAPRTVTRKIAYLLGAQAFICLLSNGVTPSIQSYSCLPYGESIYHYSVVFANIANPVACLLFYITRCRSMKLVVIFLGLIAFLASYLILAAAMSPYPPMIHNGFGGIFIIIVSILYSGFVSYLKVMIASLLSLSGVKNSLFYFGVFTQLGSAVGAILMFILVTKLQLFTAVYPCQDL